MKSFVLTAGLMMLAAPAFAQESALEIAQRQNACGENGTIISARFLDDGRVGVQCQAGVVGANCIPAASIAPTTETERRAFEIARNQNACGDRAIIGARFATDTEVRVQCAAAGVIVGDCAPGTVLAGAGAGAVGAAGATNFVPALGSLFAVVLGAAAVGGSSSTSDTR
jgi:hypothetical protein